MQDEIQALESIYGEEMEQTETWYKVVLKSSNLRNLD